MKKETNYKKEYENCMGPTIYLWITRMIFPKI